MTNDCYLQFLPSISNGKSVLRNYSFSCTYLEDFIVESVAIVNGASEEMNGTKTES